MGRNLIVCIDGTNNEFREHNTNVVKLFQCLSLGSGRQCAYYTTGVGTFTATPALTRPARALQKLLGLGFGLGLTRSIQECYRFLMDHYQDGDRIFLFGFSRGAYAVRALAGLIHRCGLLRPEHPNLISSALHFYRHRAALPLVESFRNTFARPCPIHFLGLWDTVSSVGWVWSPMTLPYTRENPSVITVRHAVSIDERRAFFRQNLWRPLKGQDVKEVWFAGVHSDVGGGYRTEQSGLSLLTLEWMLTEAAAAGLEYDPDKTKAVLSADSQPDPHAPLHQSLVPAWYPAEFWPKLSYHFLQDRRRIRFNLFRRRYLPENPTVHESVRLRIDGGTYRPPNLPPVRDWELWQRLFQG